MAWAASAQVYQFIPSVHDSPPYHDDLQMIDSPVNGIPRVRYAFMLLSHQVLMSPRYIRVFDPHDAACLRCIFHAVYLSQTPHCYCCCLNAGLCSSQELDRQVDSQCYHLEWHAMGCSPLDESPEAFSRKKVRLLPMQHGTQDTVHSSCQYNDIADQHGHTVCILISMIF